MLTRVCVSRLCRKPTNGKILYTQRKNVFPPHQTIPHFLIFKKKKGLFFFSPLSLDTCSTHDTEMYSCSLTLDVFFSLCVSETLVRRRDSQMLNILNDENKNKTKQTAGLRWQWNKMAAGSSALGNTMITIIHHDSSHRMNHCQTDITMTNDNGTVMVRGRSQPMNVYS